jgi:hypothetical protein
MRSISILLVFVAVFFSLAGKAQQQATRRVCDTIHYEFVHEKIIIPVTVNGVKVKYIVDTGGQTGTVREDAVEMKATRGIGARGVSDVNGMSLSYDEAILKDVQLSPNYKLAQMKSIIFPSNGFFRELGVVGILGSDAFAQAVVTFDARDKIMVINYPYRPEGLKITEGVPFYPGDLHHPIVDVDFGGTILRVLFDTGAQGLLSLAADDYESLKTTGSRLLASAFGISSVGIGGFDYKNATKIDKVSVDRVYFWGKEFVNVESVTVKMGRSLIGVDMLKHGKVVIDYARNRFYFFPYEDMIEDLSGGVKTWNVGILPVNGHFEITTVWDSMEEQVALGDRVVRVNGKDLSGLKQSQLEVDALLDAIEGDKTEIVILKDGKEKKVEIRKI